MTTEEKTNQGTAPEETLSLSELAQALGRELNLNNGQIARTIALLDEGNTIPFIARYRKEVTGSLDEVQIQAIADRAAALRTLYERKADVRRLIDTQGKLTSELAAAILAAATLQEVEDLYLPYRPKRKTRASVAREKGLAALADIILQQPELKGDINSILEEHARPFLDAEKGVDTSLEAYAGARDIVAEIISEDASVRGTTRTRFFKHSTLTAKVVDPEKIAEKDPNGVYQLYYDFNESQPLPGPFNQGCLWGILQGVLSALILLFLRGEAFFYLALLEGFLFYLCAGFFTVRKGGATFRGALAGFWSGIISTISFWLVFPLILLILLAQRIQLDTTYANKHGTILNFNEEFMHALQTVTPVLPNHSTSQTPTASLIVYLAGGLLCAIILGWLGGFLGKRSYRKRYHY